VNEEFIDGLSSMVQAVHEGRVAGKLGNVEVRVLTAPPRYVVGEETALLNWIEGMEAKPRFKMHLPVHKGLYQQPTLIQNAETISNVPFIFREGPESYRKQGTDKSPGTALFSVQGDVKKPGLYEMSLGTSLQELIKQAGGMKDQVDLKAALIGGNFGGFLYGDALKVNLDYEALKEVGGSLGAGIVRIYNENASITEAAENVLHFFSMETCGQCGPCHLGTDAMHKEFQKFIEDSNYDLTKLEDYSKNLRRKGACGLLDGATIVAGTVVNYVQQERGVKS
jgi:NADH-quinone oxidoreductase subunit F